MAEEKIEEHKHVVSETEDGTVESHQDKVVEKGKEEEHGVTIEKETTIKESD